MPYATVEQAWDLLTPQQFNTQPRQPGPYAQVMGVGAPLPQPDATNLGYYQIDLIDNAMNAPNSASLPSPGGSVNWSPDMSKTSSPIKTREYPKSRNPKPVEGFDDDDSSDDEDDESDKKKMLKKLQEDNRKLRKEIAHLRKQLELGGGGDNAFDLIIFLIAGIVIIFLMDTFAKMIKRY